MDVVVRIYLGWSTSDLIKDNVWTWRCPFELTVSMHVVNQSLMEAWTWTTHQEMLLSEELRIVLSRLYFLIVIEWLLRPLIQHTFIFIHPFAYAELAQLVALLHIIQFLCKSWVIQVGEQFTLVLFSFLRIVVSDLNRLVFGTKARLANVLVSDEVVHLMNMRAISENSVLSFPFVDRHELFVWNVRHSVIIFDDLPCFDTVGECLVSILFICEWVFLQFELSWIKALCSDILSNCLVYDIFCGSVSWTRVSLIHLSLLCLSQSWSVNKWVVLVLVRHQFLLLLFLFITITIFLALLQFYVLIPSFS